MSIGFIQRQARRPVPTLIAKSSRKSLFVDQDRAASLNVLRELYIVHLRTLLPSLVADYLAKRIVADSITISSVTRGKIRTGI